MAIDNALTRYQAAEHYAREHMQMIEERATQAASILAAYPFLTESTANSFAVRDLFAEVMRNNNMLYSIYLGYPNGDFYELINLDNTDEIRASVNAVAQDRWVVNRVSMVNGNRVRQLDYYAADFILRDSHYEASNYDSRKRHWFQNAQLTNVNVSAPYLFQYLQKPGKTYSIKLPNSEIVLGIDVALQSFSQYFEHIDQEVFSLFLTNGVYLQYAKRFLAAEQIDEIDVQQYIRATR